MATFPQWLLEQAKASIHSAHVIDPPPAVAGAGESMLLAIGAEPNKVVYVAFRHGGSTVRVGFAAKDRWANEEIEEAVESNGGTMTEFLEDEMEADDELVHEVQHFHEAGWFHFASDIAKTPAYFDTAEGHDEVWYYVSGYARAILPIVVKKDDGE